ncbi:hypothetical protein ACLI09_14930 [Flavobacterium sp. RHBU_24]|uniref:hypothetical protein n=1 Tax=Flavobacterium sp. RHBU_24 TaxID=3391185 RepID=UPI003984DF7B
MKRITLLFALLAAGCVTANAQVDSVYVVNNGSTTAHNDLIAKKHELKFGAIKALSGGIVEVTYERIYSESFTYGLSMLGNLDGNNNDYPEDFSVTPFARMYFSEPKYYGAKGFFVEGSAKFITGRDYNGYTEEYVYEDGNGNTYYNYYDKRVSYTAGSLGLAIGWKWINKAGFVFEILGGAGRNFGGSNAPEANFRGDFNLGYRF